MDGVPRRRPERPDDDAFLAELFAQAHPLPGLDPALAATLMRQQRAAQAAGYRAAHPAARFDVVEVGGEPVGRLVVDEGREGWQIVDVAFVAAWRGRGLGTRLLGEVMAGAAEAGVPLRLRVDIGNAGARRLYERIGFVPATAEVDDGMNVAMIWPSAARGC